MEIHDRDELLNNQVKEEIPLVDIEAKIKADIEKNQPVIEDPK